MARGIELRKDFDVAALLGGVTLQSIRDWVLRLNAQAEQEAAPGAQADC